MDNFSQSGKSQISLLWCVSHITLQRPCLASTWPRGTHAKKPFCLCSKRDVGPGHGRWKWEKVERREGLKRRDISEARGLRSNMTPPQSSCLRAEDPSCPSPSTVASVLHQRPHLPSTTPQKWPPWFSHYIANMQSFLWFKNNNNNLEK